MNSSQPPDNAAQASGAGDHDGPHQQARHISSMGLIIRQTEPRNLETPLAEVDSFLTPTELFYIRSHFTTPELDIGSYRLRIDGAVRSPFSLGYHELRDMPSETRIATLECAGNGRLFLVPQVEGAQWELGAVGNAAWTGVPLGALLDRAGLEAGACEIVLEGVDQEYRRKDLHLPVRSRMPAVCPETKPCSGKC